VVRRGPAFAVMLPRPESALVSGARAAILGLVLAGCAVPVPPSGGPPDDRPPQVAETHPPDGAVGVRPDRVRIIFDEFIEARTAQRAISITPTPSRPPEIRPGARSVDILFREPLRDSTTYIITIDAGLTDAHGVSLAAPVRVAFSTGDRINRGRMSGFVIRASDGQPDAAMDVYAYPTEAGKAPATLPGEGQLPDYRTQTDAEGRFSFEYLRESSYFVLGVRDANRNRTPDAGEAIAWPPVSVVFADSNSTAAGTWLSTNIDTTDAVLRRASAISSSRLTLRFVDPVRIPDRGADLWLVGDSTFSDTVVVRSAYQPLRDRRVVMLTTDLLTANTYWVRGTVSDSVGNRGPVGPVSFRSSIRPDTTRPLFRGFVVDTLATDEAVRILRPDQSVGLQFSAPPDGALLRSGVAVADSAGVLLDWVTRSATGTLLQVDVASRSWYTVSVDLAAFGGADSIASVVAMATPPSYLGELIGVVEPGPHPIYVRAHRAGDDTVHSVPADSSGAFLFGGLPGRDSYLLSFFEDANSNGRWDFGRLQPFSPAERLGWYLNPTTIRARWEVSVPDTLSLRSWVPSPAADTTGS